VSRPAYRPHVEDAMANERDSTRRRIALSPRPSSCSRARTTSSRRPRRRQHLLNQRGEDEFVHRRELHQACVQTLQLRLRHGVEIHTRSDLGRTHPLQPTEKNLSCARVCDRLLAQTALDLGVTRRLPCTARCALGIRGLGLPCLQAGPGNTSTADRRPTYAVALRRNVCRPFPLSRVKSDVCRPKKIGRVA
jgi:hypothetical protein